MSSIAVRRGWASCLVLMSALAGSSVFAQVPGGSRITGPVDDHARVSLPGNVHPLARARFDQGRVPDSFPLHRVLLLLQRSPDRETALQEFLQDAHRRGASRYHQWLTPEQFGEVYGPDDSEIATVSGWLQSHGLAVARITKSKTGIEFSGTAKQFGEAFHTEIHTYMVNGEAHHANSADPQIPAALAAVVAGLTPINDFHPRSNMEVLGKSLYHPQTHEIVPSWTLGTDEYALAPGDFAVQYDLNPLYNAGTDGTGVTIGIIGASDIDPTGVDNFHTLFGLPPSHLNVVIDGNDTDPNEGNWATGETYLDVEMSGAVATGSTINLYTAADTSVQQGLLLAAQRAVDDDQAAVLSLSYSECEAELGRAGNQFWAGLWEQAAAQGQTPFVAAGDSGSAGCDDFNSGQAAQSGLAVNGFASSPWNVAVGGTDFFYSTYSGTSDAQQQQLATYWNPTVASFPPVTSLLQTIPEQPWNHAFGLNLSDGGVYDPSKNGTSIVGGSGGASVFYQKPAWQNGRGVPADGARDLPDVSLFAADGENGSFYVMCAGADNCVAGPGGGYIQIIGVGGTSASTPEMAGIMALVNEKYGRQGQANFIFYPLAAQHRSVFHDVAIGSNNVPCQQGSPNCAVSALNDNTNGFYTLGHYYANAGYDQATGLGSVDANLLLQYWNSLTFTPSATTLSTSQTTFTHGTPITLNVSVSGTGGTPSGDVGLVTNASPASNTSMGELTLSKGTASTTVNNLPGGEYQVTAKYTGDTVFAPSNSNPMTLNVAPENSTVSLTATYWSNSSNAFTAVANSASYPYGTYIAVDGQPKGVNSPQGSTDGLATGTIIFNDSVGGISTSSNPVGIDREGIAEWVPAIVLPVGTHTLSASYSGDPSFNASSNSAAVTFTIGKAQPGAYLVARPSPIALGSITELDFSVGAGYDSPLPAPPSSTYAFSSPVSPTGSVTFSYGTTVLGTVTLAANYGDTYGSSGTFSTSALPIGTDTVTAVYSGDGNYLPVTATFNVAVEQAPNLSATANPSSIDVAEYTAVTATVAGMSGKPVPTGTISYFAAGPGSDWTDSEPLVKGSATSKAIPGGLFNVPGAASVAVTYSGDTVYGPASVNVNVNVVAGDALPFALSGTPVTIATPGATASNTSSITVSPANGFTGIVYLSCALTSSPNGAVQPPTCSVPPSVNISGGAAAALVMTINTTAPTTTASAHLNAGFWGGSVAVAGLLVSSIGRRRRRFASLSVCLCLMSILAGCGGGGSRGITGTPPETLPGTTAGTYVFTVSGAFSANGPSQNQTTVPVTVQ